MNTLPYTPGAAVLIVGAAGRGKSQLLWRIALEQTDLGERVRLYDNVYVAADLQRKFKLWDAQGPIEVRDNYTQCVDFMDDYVDVVLLDDVHQVHPLSVRDRLGDKQATLWWIVNHHRSTQGEPCTLIATMGFRGMKKEHPTVEDLGAPMFSEIWWFIHDRQVECIKGPHLGTVVTFEPLLEPGNVE